MNESSFILETRAQLAKAAQVFVIEPTRGPRHMLIIPKGTFEHPDLPFLCNANLADALQRARDVPLTLTTTGVR